MEKILISACLVGENCTYKGENNKIDKLDQLLQKYELIPFCPEVEGGLSIPRVPSEIKDGKVISKKGDDFTKYFLAGAEKAYNICLYLSITKVILKENSPSCGKSQVYNGEFRNRLIPGMGITASYLMSRGIKVYSENEIEQLL